MNNYLLDINQKELKDLLCDFYALTNIRIVIFDIRGNIIISYPEKECALCTIMTKCEKTHKLCLESNRRSFEKCSNTKQLTIYHCHAGLVEATTPLINENNHIIGYVMFGQITDESNKKKINQDLENYLEQLDIKFANSELYIKHKTPEQIKAAAKILETCTLYLLNHNFISLSKDEFVSKIDSFIDLNIGGDLSIDKIADYFDYSRTNLYAKWNSYISISIAEYIKSKRIEKAKWYLQYSKEKMNNISLLVGFNDYNYFCRCFKKEVGMPAKKYRLLKSNLI